MGEKRSIRVKEIVVEVNPVVSDGTNQTIKITNDGETLSITADYYVITAITKDEHENLRYGALKIFEHDFALN